jgi:hypothetical protein
MIVVVVNEKKSKCVREQGSAYVRFGKVTSQTQNEQTCLENLTNSTDK